MADLGAIGKLATRVTRITGGIFSGKVYDHSGAPAAHIVRAYNRETGEFSGGAISDPTNDGHYTLYAGIKHALKPHYGIEIDSGNSQNARVFDLIYPI